MKFLFSFLILTLCFGVHTLYNRPFCCHAPQWVKSVLHQRFHIDYETLVLQPHCIEFNNLTTNFLAGTFQCKRLTLKIKTLGLGGILTVHLDHGTLKLPHKTLNIQGRIEKRHNTYRGLMRINDAELWLQDFIPFTLISALLSQNTTALEDLTLDGIQCYTSSRKDGVQAQYHCKDLRYRTLQASNLKGISVFKNPQQGVTFLQAETFHLSSMATNAFLSFEYAKLWTQKPYFKSICFWGQGRLFTIPSATFFVHSPKFNLHRPNLFLAHIQSEQLHIQTRGLVHGVTKQWYLTQMNGRIAPLGIAHYLKMYPIPYPLTFTQPVQIYGFGNLNHLHAKLQTAQLRLNHRAVGKSLAEIHYYRNQPYIRYKTQIQMAAGPFSFQGQYHYKTHSGRLSCKGWLDPHFTYPLAQFLPQWWYKFFSAFTFDKKPPWTDFDLKWGKDTSQLFGLARIKQGCYKQTKFKQLSVIFGHQPGYLFLNIYPWISQKESGNCTIHWPYIQDKTQLNLPQERWIFEGEGHYRIAAWTSILKDFLGNKERFNALRCFQSQSQAHVTFKGIVSQEELPSDYFSLNADFAKTQCQGFPMAPLTFSYQWTPHGIQMHTQQCGLFEKAPLALNYTQTGKQFSLKAKGKKIPTGELLLCPRLADWVQTIPENNRKSYEGDLDVEIQCTGQVAPHLHWSGEGHLNFQNPNLSEIHILGPLSHLMLKGTSLNPSVQLNQVVSDFSFTEDKIVSKRTQLLGPSTRADLDGTIDIPTKSLSANIHFSFLDAQQVKLPILRHLMRLFSPISKGFSASVQGPLDAPQWITTFNPFRFVFPDNPGEKRKPRKFLKQKEK